MIMENSALKFKIWDKFNKVMSEPFEISELIFDWNVIWQDRFKGQKEIAGCDMVYLQFTGKVDRHGKEIYNGDIFKYELKACHENDIDTIYTEEVHFTQGSFELDNCPLYAFCEYGEVIGNIYENPDLLK
jgi:uncharacterized phage protein (TIGR01671 family)